MALDEAIDILKLLVPIAKTVPILGAPVEGSLEALSRILEFAQGVKATRKKTEELAVQAARWLNTVFDVLKDLELKVDHSEIEGLRPNVQEIHKALISIVQFTEHCAKQGPLAQTLRKYKDEEEISKLSNTLEAAFRRFQFESHIRIEKALNTVLTTTDNILTTANTLIPTTSAILTTTNNALTATQTLLTAAETETLRSLKPVFSARYNSRDSPGGCFKDTREDVLDAMHSWLAESSSLSSSSMSIFWLAGLAGTGKSTIIKTFCERVDNDDNVLLASFFASRNSAERRDPYRILHTFAYQLAVASDRIRAYIVSSLQAPQDVMQETMHEQVKQLLAEPIKRAQLAGRTIVFAIDALDECHNNAAGVEGYCLIELLAQVLRNQPVKLLVTSRQEDSIASMFRSLSHVPLRLHEIASAIVEGDVRRIFDAGFAEIHQRRAHDLGTISWPTQSQLDTLVKRTGALFIYAATVLKFVNAPRFSPKGRLRRILEGGSAISTSSSNPYLQIDALYASVLKSATEDMPDTPDAELCQRVGSLLRTVVLLEESVSVHALAHLMGIFELDDIQQMENDVRALGSVLLISPGSESERFSETVSTFHPSFRDFLGDSRRCPDDHFLVEPAKHQNELLYRCLQLLNKHLRHDICNIQNPGLPNVEVQNLSERLVKSVPDAVRYACKYWQIHLVASGSLSESVSLALLELCTHHLLHWLEVLSILGEVSSASQHLPRSIAWCQGQLLERPAMKDIFVLLKDAHRVMRTYAIPITSHALQVYHSVLATSPRCKLLDCMRSSQIAAPHLVSERASNWSPVLQVLEGHTGGVNSVACSPDGTNIVSGSSDRTVRVWDAKTGKELAVLEGSLDVNSVAISPDGAHIVLGSVLSTVQVCDAHTGNPLAALEGHSDEVNSVAFSPDGAHILSGSGDKTVRVWDVQSGKEIAMFDGHSSAVRSVAFSPDGAHVVSSSDDRTVRVWDAHTGKELAVLKGHRKSVLSVAFAPDGAQIVSGSHDKTVRVWNAHTGKELAVLKGHSKSVLSVTFSPDGAQIVSGSAVGTVQVWDAHTGKKLATLDGHSDYVRSVAFSPDGAYIVSGSIDTTVRMWDAEIGKDHVTLAGHGNPVRSVAFSQDGAHIISASDDKIVRVWNAHTGKELAVLEDHGDYVWSVAFSPDGAHIVSSSDDETVRVWNAQTGKELVGVESHSNRLCCVAFSPDGAHIVSGCDDNTVQVWDAQTGKQLAVLEGHSSRVCSVAFSPDGAHITSSDIHGHEVVWSVKGTVHVLKKSQDETLTDEFADLCVAEVAEVAQSHYSEITYPAYPHAEDLVWEEETGWISWRSSNGSWLPLCWMPVERRGDTFASRGTTAVIGARTGAVTIVDFSDVIVTFGNAD